eukprot:Rmarinus@m.10407
MLKYKLMFLRASGTLLLMIPMLYLGFFSIFSSNTAAYVQAAKKASDDNKVSIANAGAIPPLVKLLKESNNAKVQTQVAACLENLAKNNDVKSQIESEKAKYK